MKLIHNRFEKIVIERVQAEAAKLPELSKNRELPADAACIALNMLRPHYIRHDLDLKFYMTDARRSEEELEISAAVAAALVYLQHGDRNKPSTK